MMFLIFMLNSIVPSQKQILDILMEKSSLDSKAKVISQQGMAAFIDCALELEKLRCFYFL